MVAREEHSGGPEEHCGGAYERHRAGGKKISQNAKRLRLWGFRAVESSNRRSIPPKNSPNLPNRQTLNRLIQQTKLLLLIPLSHENQSFTRECFEAQNSFKSDLEESPNAKVKDTPLLLFLFVSFFLMIVCEYCVI